MTKDEFLAEIGPAAVDDMIATGVLASITIAQAILESNWGKSAPRNNLFGIKGSGQVLKTMEEINGKMVEIEDGFAVYDSWVSSIFSHSLFLKVNDRYKTAGFFTACDRLDFIGAAKALQRAGYATDSLYADKLVAIITTYRLFEYDKEAFGKVNKLTKDEVNFILNVLGYYWGEMAGNDEVRDYTHYIANRLRDAYGIPKEN